MQPSFYGHRGSHPLGGNSTHYRLTKLTRECARSPARVSHAPPKHPESSYAGLQGFKVTAPIPSKSFVFRVTMISSYASAVAAINESIAGKGLPVRDACA